MMHQSMQMGMSAMNQGMGQGMPMMQQGMTNMGSMPGIMPGAGFGSFLGSLISTGISLLILAVFIGGMAFLAKSLWEMYKAKKTNRTQEPVIVAKQVEVLD
jgi:hypothetical protein